METTPRPNSVQFCVGEPMRHPMLAAESRQAVSRRQRGGGVAAQQLEEEFGLERMGH